MQVVSIISTKGGVGKTTTAANLGGFVADAGLRVLLLDLDVQPTLSSYFTLGERAPAGIYEMLAYNEQRDERLHGHIVSPAPTTDRLQSIQRMVADQMDDTLPNFETDVLRAIPVQAGGLYPITDVWYIEPGLDMPDRLRVHIAQFAREIAEEADVAELVKPSDVSIGFVCGWPSAARALPPFARAVLTLLHALCAVSQPVAGFDHARLADDLAPLLYGGGASPRLSDAGLVKLFRLLRLARRLLDLETGTASSTPGHSV